MKKTAKKSAVKAAPKTARRKKGAPDAESAVALEELEDAYETDGDEPDAEGVAERPAGKRSPRHLVIVESPSKAKTLTKFLGRGFTVMASNGHIMDLPTSKLGVDIENDFQPEYVAIRGKKKILDDLKKKAREVDVVYMAPDPDREGEAIAWHLRNWLGKANGTLRRLTFNEITERAVKDSLNHAREIDENLVNAQQARRVLDRLVGYKVSPLLWNILRYGLSAGRVQSVALRIICDREKEIRAFNAVEYWTIEARLAAPGSPPSPPIPEPEAQAQYVVGTEEKAPVAPLGPGEFYARLIKVGDEKPELTDGTTATSLVESLQGRPFTVTEVKKRERRKNPAPPFITSTLQQDAFKKHRYSSQKTMVLAQQLYEGIDLGEGPVGLITYMRTDSTRIAQEALDAVRGHIRSSYGDRYLPETARTFPTKKAAQDAHEAVRPSEVDRTPESLARYLQPDLLKLYTLIWNRFVASQMTPAVYETTSVDIRVDRAAGDPVTFRASGTVPIFDGFTRLWASLDEEEEEPTLPALEEGTRVEDRGVVPSQHFTEPPPRFTEATLVKALEENGIGRPSTYATIVSTILTRDYVLRDRGKLTPTELGMTVTDLLIKTFPDIFNVDFTAQMENELDRIETGEEEWHSVIKGFWDPFASDLTKAEGQKAELKAGLQEETDILCPKCGEETGSKMIKKYGRNGIFLACPRYPDCKATQPYDQAEVETTDEVCEKCSGPMVVKRGRFGRFLACSNYPDCKSTRPYRIGVPCPEKDCGGQLSEKRSKRGKMFYGCDRWPECNFATWDRPVPV
ncbi:MAG TPA: type I DNA topoisomerase, partial [Candidatus Eisenbacteria bacterium]